MVNLSTVVGLTLGFVRTWVSAETNLQETDPLLWIMIAIAAGGSIITFAFLVYALWKYRDPKVKNRRYG